VKVHQKKKNKKMKLMENGMVLARGGRVSIARISQGKEKQSSYFYLFLVFSM
jgi:hypothetical protein